MDQLNSVPISAVYQMAQSFPPEERRDFLSENTSIYFPEMLDVFGDVNAMYIITAVEQLPDGNYHVQYFDAGGGDHWISVPPYTRVIYYG